MTEAKIQADILRYLATLPNVRAWRNNCGAAIGSRGVVRFGVPGQADISGILSDGRRLEIEVKTATGNPSKQQLAFGEMINRFRGVYIVARSVDEVRIALEFIDAR